MRSGRPQRRVLPREYTRDPQTIYLVFCDRGDARYVNLKCIRVICDNSKEAGDPRYRSFIRCYLSKYPHRDLVHVEPGQNVVAHFESGNEKAEVIEVDCSTAKLKFRDGRTIWLFRSVPFMRSTHENTKRDSTTATMAKTATTAMEVGPTMPRTPSHRAVAKKCTRGSRPPGTPVYHPVQKIPLPVDSPVPKKLHTHKCNYRCVSWVPVRRCDEPIIVEESGQRKEILVKNPLAFPLLNGWRREIVKRRSRDQSRETSKVKYTTPCGRQYEKTEDIFQYLRKVESTMTIDMFDFHVEVRPLARFAFDEKHIVLSDITNGKEEVAIHVYNDIDSTLPEKFRYWNTYFRSTSVNPKFLPTCNCENGCRDERLCSCSEITLKEMEKMYPNRSGDATDDTYNYRRLFNRIDTGVFECNNWCKCPPTCLNRVAQNPLKVELQLFKTRDKGWGVRSLYDLPVGTFICTYAGDLLTNEDAEQEGNKNGDMYFVELDHREVAERAAQKEGYEREFEYDFSLEDSPTTDSSRSRKRVVQENTGGEKRRKCSTPSTEDEIGTSSNEAKISQDNFVVNAKYKGNISRFFNHSCEPNTFAQNVFIDNHDVQFPRMALFAATHIRAGAELTWDYGYIPNSVPDHTTLNLLSQ